ncbi:MAG TPA: YdcF family protein [Xanthobacteraceae bacterium]|nr:YdcF family protein [Xanthobacteraceae bacterium]
MLEGGSAHGRGFRFVTSFMGMMTLVLAAFFGGFVLFANMIPREEEDPLRFADGIVALTGGPSRISDAVELLAAGRGKRLLISGVNPSTTPGELIKLTPELEKLFNCCVDLGHQALNTTGNAMEIAQWTREHEFHSIIVVTSAWHMPRAFVELERELSGVELIPHAVVSDRMRDEPWWTNPQTARLLLVEYVKYLATYARVRFDVFEQGAAPNNAARTARS